MKNKRREPHEPKVTLNGQKQAEVQSDRDGNGFNWKMQNLSPKKKRTKKLVTFFTFALCTVYIHHPFLKIWIIYSLTNIGQCRRFCAFSFLCLGSFECTKWTRIIIHNNICFVISRCYIWKIERERGTESRKRICGCCFRWCERFVNLSKVINHKFCDISNVPLFYSSQTKKKHMLTNTFLFSIGYCAIQFGLSFQAVKIFC